MKDYEKSLH